MTSAVASWRRVRQDRVQDCRVFDVHRVSFAAPQSPSPRDYFVVRAPDWINVVPLTDDGAVVMVRQYRFGVEDFTLEIPGGMCDPGETPGQAARRELAEETGYAARLLARTIMRHRRETVEMAVISGTRRVEDPRRISTIRRRVRDPRTAESTAISAVAAGGS